MQELNTLQLVTAAAAIGLAFISPTKDISFSISQKVIAAKEKRKIATLIFQSVFAVLVALISFFFLALIPSNHDPELESRKKEQIFQQGERFSRRTQFDRFLDASSEEIRRIAVDSDNEWQWIDSRTPSSELLGRYKAAMADLESEVLKGIQSASSNIRTYASMNVTDREITARHSEIDEVLVGNNVLFVNLFKESPKTSESQQDLKSRIRETLLALAERLENFKFNETARFSEEAG